MFNPLMLLAAEASGVITLRMMKLMLGGRSARREANLMVSEKIKADHRSYRKSSSWCIRGRNSSSIPTARSEKCKTAIGPEP